MSEFVYRPASSADDALVFLDFMSRYSLEKTTADNFRGIASVIRSLSRRLGEQASVLEKVEAGSLAWLDISTAPRDGTEVLLACWQAGVWIVRNGCWDDAQDLPTDAVEDREKTIGWWYFKNCCTQEKLEGIFEPTHWCPMAVPPREFAEAFKRRDA